MLALRWTTSSGLAICSKINAFYIFVFSSVLDAPFSGGKVEDISAISVYYHLFLYSPLSWPPIDLLRVSFASLTTVEGYATLLAQT